MTSTYFVNPELDRSKWRDIIGTVHMNEKSSPSASIANRVGSLVGVACGMRHAACDMRRISCFSNQSVDARLV
jgi:hypothetical protein